MGTRSLTHVKDTEGNTILTIYRQFDGYPTGLGLRLAYLAHKTIVNGFTMDMDMKTHANGMGCLAAQIVAGLKNELGNVYIVPPDSHDMGEEFIYTIHPPTETPDLPLISAECVDGISLVEKVAPHEFKQMAGLLE